MTVVLAIMMVPTLSIVTGVYTLLVSLKATSTYSGIIAVTAAFGLPLSIFLYRNFIAAIPQSLDEASAIDGASVFQTFYHVILPQLAPVTVSVIIMKGISAWNEFDFRSMFFKSPGCIMSHSALNSFFLRLLPI